MITYYSTTYYREAIYSNMCCAISHKDIKNPSCWHPKPHDSSLCVASLSYLALHVFKCQAIKH